MVSIYNQMKQGDGFVSKKIFVNNKDFIGYEIVRLSTDEKIPFAYKSQYMPPNWDEIYRYGPFSFSKGAINFAERIGNEIITNSVGPFFIDEIGLLELSGTGFSTILEKILKTQRDIYITVRNRFVEDVIKKFKIRNYKIIMANETSMFR